MVVWLYGRLIRTRLTKRDKSGFMRLDLALDPDCLLRYRALADQLFILTSDPSQCLFGIALFYFDGQITKNHCGPAIV